MSGKTATLRIGIDTGGTFTDIVSVDTVSGAMRVTKVASTPANPAIGLVRGVQRDSRRRAALPPTMSRASPTAPRLRPMRCCRARSNALGLIVNAGFRHILEIARQSVPEGYGNSYFWVKPERIVPLRNSSARSAAGWISAAPSCGRSMKSSVRDAARFFRSARRARGRHLPAAFLRQRRRTSAALLRSSPRNIRTRRCRCPAWCCRNIANMSAR